MKKVNLWKTLFLSALAVAAFTGCSDDDPDDGGGMPSITVNGAESARVAVGLDGGKTEAVTIESSGDWTVTFEGSDTDDCVAVPATGGKGSTSVYFELGSRTAERTITAKVVTYGTISGLSVPVPASVTITILQNSDGTTELQTNVKQVRDALSFDGSAVSASTVITGIVVSDYVGNNINNHQIMIADNSTEAGAGMLIRFKGYVGSKDTDYNLTKGMLISLDLQGGIAQRYNDIQYQVDFTSATKDPEITIKDAGDNTPAPITVNDVADLVNYQSQYVQLYSQPIESIRGEKYYNVSSGYANQTFQTKNGSTFDLSFMSYTSSWAKDVTIPSNAGYIKGCVSFNYQTPTLSPRNADDLTGMTESLFDIEASETTIKDIGVGSYKLSDVTIVGVHQKGVMFAQEVSGTVYYVLGFNNGWTTQTANPYINSVGKLADVEGTTEDRYGLYQFSTFEVTTGNDSSLKLPTPETFDATAIEAYTKAPAYKYVKLSGVLHIEKGSSYNTYTITVAGSSVQNITFAYGLDAKFSGVADGDVVDATGFALGYDTSNSKLNIMLTEIAKNTSTAAVTITTTPTTFSADGGTQDITFTVANAGSNKTYAKIEGTGFSVPSGEVTSPVKVTAEANSGEAREAKLTIYVAASENGAAVAEASVTLKQSAKATGGEGAAYEWILASGNMKQAGGETPAVGTPTAMVWSYSSAGYLQMASNGSAMQIGSAKNPATDWSVWTENYSGTISKIVVTVNTGGSATMIVKIGDTQIGEEVTLESSPKAFTFEPESPMSGKITINLKAESKALYLKSIAINPAE